METGALRGVTHSSVRWLLCAGSSALAPLRWPLCADGVLAWPRLAVWAHLAGGAEPLDTDAFVLYTSPQEDLGGRIREAR
jgi:hypothetical protein